MPEFCQKKIVLVPPLSPVSYQGRSQKFVLGGYKSFGGIKLLIAVLTSFYPIKSLLGLIFFFGGGV